MHIPLYKLLIIIAVYKIILSLTTAHPLAASIIRKTDKLQP